MRVLVNGEPVTLDPGTTVAAVATDRPGIAVAVNGEVVPRHRHPVTVLEGGDVVEVVTAVQGG